MNQDEIRVKAAAILELRRRHRERMTFTEYLNEVSPNIDPKLHWDIKHLEYMRPYLDKISRGESLHPTKNIKRLMVFCPPQSGKSMQNTIYFSAFFLEKNPLARELLLAYNQDTANGFSREIRDICSTRMKLKTNSEKQWALADGGSLKAAGINGTITGKPADLIVIDDPVKNHSEAYSPTWRERTWQNYRTCAESRIRESTYVILTQTRWHTDDLAGKILEKEEDLWVVVSLPALAGKDDPLGRKEGEALWPEEHPRELLLQKKLPGVLIDPEFEALYQCNPTPVGGTLFREEHFSYYDKLPEDFDFIIQSWDTSFEVKTENDPSVCATIGIKDECYYLIDIMKDRLPYHVLKDRIKLEADDRQPDFILIEKAASGHSLIQELLHEGYYVEGISPLGESKYMRARATTQLFAKKQVMFPREADWLGDFLFEILAFPASKHDDQVDALTMGLNYGRQKCTMGEMGIATV